MSCKPLSLVVGLRVRVCICMAPAPIGSCIMLCFFVERSRSRPHATQRWAPPCVLERAGTTCPAPVMSKPCTRRKRAVTSCRTNKSCSFRTTRTKGSLLAPSGMEHEPTPPSQMQVGQVESFVA
jgi:hypothetical protein